MSMTAVKIMAVATGGALGASLRYLVAAATHDVFGHGFPYGTLMVNIVGSAIIGYLVVLIPETDTGLPIARLLLITGLLGGFTTYSAFSIETLEMMQDGHLTKAGLNILTTMFACLFSVWAGYLLARLVHGSS